MPQRHRAKPSPKSPHHTSLPERKATEACLGGSRPRILFAPCWRETAGQCKRRVGRGRSPTKGTLTLPYNKHRSAHEAWSAPAPAADAAPPAVEQLPCGEAPLLWRWPRSLSQCCCPFSPGGTPVEHFGPIPNRIKAVVLGRKEGGRSGDPPAHSPQGLLYLLRGPLGPPHFKDTSKDPTRFWSSGREGSAASRHRGGHQPRGPHKGQATLELHAWRHHWGGGPSVSSTAFQGGQPFGLLCESMRSVTSPLFTEGTLWAGKRSLSLSSKAGNIF